MKYALQLIHHSILSGLVARTCYVVSAYMLYYQCVVWHRRLLALQESEVNLNPDCQVIVLGAPGAGKTTQAAEICNRDGSTVRSPGPRHSMGLAPLTLTLRLGPHHCRRASLRGTSTEPGAGFCSWIVCKSRVRGAWLSFGRVVKVEDLVKRM